MNYIIYNQDGKINRLVSCSNIEQQLQSGEFYIEGFANDATQYIDNKQIVNMPSKPNEFSEFDYQTKNWVSNYALADSIAKQKRSGLLIESDWTQLPDVSISTKQTWAVYRQTLRDITSQSGYPYSVIWPTKPE
jgi:hypothetical protein